MKTLIFSLEKNITFVFELKIKSPWIRGVVIRIATLQLATRKCTVTI
jgi:hypothetical protein